MDTPEFNQAIEFLQNELQAIRAGQANPAVVEDVRIEAYNDTMALKELASISAPDSQSLLIDPWDKSLLKNIESGISASDIDIQPIVDGEVIRMNFPSLTEERRVEYVKKAQEKGENTRIVIKKTREDVLKKLKQQQKDGDISEDDYFAQEKEVQQTVDDKNAQIKELVAKKEAELMTI
jgi:ribosome recycling factor